jgi:hypothetical protein
MIIPNPVLKLDYDPAIDVLSIDWPDFREYSISEVIYVLDSVIETIKNYDIKYLLTDTRKGIVEMSDDKYKKLALNFAVNLKSTRLKKLARIVNTNTLREQTVKDVSQQAQLTIPIKNFDKKDLALDWFKFGN